MVTVVGADLGGGCWVAHHPLRCYDNWCSAKNLSYGNFLSGAPPSKKNPESAPVLFLTVL